MRPHQVASLATCAAALWFVVLFLNVKAGIVGLILGTVYLLSYLIAEGPR